MEDLLGTYAETRGGAAYDEMFDGADVRPSYAGVQRAFAAMGFAELRSRAELLASSYLDQGVTFAVGGDERPFPLDIVPRLIEADRWRQVETGVRQRVRALERFLADIYGAGQVFRDGVVPRSVVMTSPHFHRVVADLTPPNGVRVHVAGIDLIRDEAGDFRVLEDNVRVPSGVSYVMTNRSAISKVLPELFAGHHVRQVRTYPSRLLAALRASAPAGVTDPTVVVMTPGIHNSAYFEHALLARRMGIELVEGRDLVCRRGKVCMRTTTGLQPVHVIYRRVDDEFLDPVHFRPDSVLGVPGIINAARTGNVTIANAIGNGVADDKLVYTYVPDLIRYYLAEKPVLDNVPTWRLGEPDAMAEVLDRIDQLVLKPVDGSGGYGIVIGPRATRAELDQLRKKLRRNPRAWIAQPVVNLSTAPTLVGAGIRPRHVDLRPFAVNDGEDVWVLPGGLTRVALPEGELVVNSSRGGGSKDTWVLGAEEDLPPAEDRHATTARGRAAVPTDPDDVPAVDPGPVPQDESAAAGAQQQ